MRRALLFVLALSGPAAAQRLTEGLFLPDGNPAAGEGAAMLEANPAGMAFGAPVELAYTFVDSQAEQTGEGHQLALSFGLDPFRAGISLQFLDPTTAGVDDGPTKVSLGYALRLSPAFAFGFAWHTFVSDDDPELDEADTWDLGFQLRPSRWLAAGLSITDLTSPRVGGVIVNRAYVAGLSFRPGTERFTATGTLTIPETRDDTPADHRELAFGGLLRWRLFGAIGLQARYETTEIGGERTHRLMAGLVDVSAFGLGAFLYSPDLAGDDVGATP
ncbi:MAG: hypothetical protein R3F60_24645 [bacterium]